MIFSIFKGFVEGIAASTIIVLIVAAFFSYAPDFEVKHMPVISNFKIQLVKQEDTYRLYTVSFNKLRSCDIDISSVTWYILTNEKELEKVKVVLPAPSGDPTRPVGANISKEWKVYIPKGQQVKQETFVVYHYCHPGWRTRTEVTIDNK